MVWVGILGVAAVIEARAIRRHSGTASEAIATLFRTETPAGRAAFLATLGGTSVWLARHIVRFEYSVKELRECES